MHASTYGSCVGPQEVTTTASTASEAITSSPPGRALAAGSRAATAAARSASASATATTRLPPGPPSSRPMCSWPIRPTPITPTSSPTAPSSASSRPGPRCPTRPGSGLGEAQVNDGEPSRGPQDLDGDVVRGDALDARVPGPRGAGERAVGLQDHVAGAAQAEGEVVVQHRGQPPVPEQGEVLRVEVVGDEGAARPPGAGEGRDGRGVATGGVHRVHGGDARVRLERVLDEPAQHVVVPGRVHLVDLPPPGPHPPHGRAEPHLPLAVTPEAAARPTDDDGGAV